eukprot:COSAG01_NODE_7264_length_3277_cov_2.415041_1_plen_922_part_00
MPVPVVSGTEGPLATPARDHAGQGGPEEGEPPSVPSPTVFGGSPTFRHEQLESSSTHAAAVESDLEERLGQCKLDAAAEKLRRELSCTDRTLTNCTLSALYHLAAETAGVDPRGLKIAMDTGHPKEAIFDIIVHARMLGGSWAAQDSLVLLRWARLWQRWDSNSRQPLADDQAVHKKIISRSVRGFLEEHRPEALVAVLAIILGDARQQRRRTHGDTLPENQCCSTERPAAKDTKKWWRMEARFLEQLWCRGVSEDQFDVLRYIKQITQEMVFDDFVLPVISMYLDSAEFAKYLVYWLAEDGNPLIAFAATAKALTAKAIRGLITKIEQSGLDPDIRNMFTCASGVCTQNICDQNGDVIGKHDTHGFTWLECKAEEKLERKAKEGLERDALPNVQPQGEAPQTNANEQGPQPWSPLKVTQAKKITDQIDRSIKDTIRMLADCTSSHGGWVEMCVERCNGQVPQHTHALLEGVVNHGSVLVVSDIYDLGNTVYDYDEEADTVSPRGSGQAGTSRRQVHPSHDIRYRYGTIDGKGRDVEYVMISEHVETLEEVQKIVMQAFNPNWQKQQLNQETDSSLPDSKTFIFPPKLLLSVNQNQNQSGTEPEPQPKPEPQPELEPRPEQAIKDTSAMQETTADENWKAFVKELFTKAREPALSYEPFFKHRLPKTSPDYKTLHNAQYKDQPRLDLTYCTHLILFQKGSPFAKPPGSGHTLMERLQHEKAVRRVIAMTHGNDTDLRHVLRQLEDPKRNRHLTVMPLIGAAGASHFLGRAAELYNYSDQAALARLAIANLPLGMVAGREVSGGIQQATLNHLRSVVSKDVCRQRICPLDITAQPDQGYLNQLITNSLWGIDHKGFDEMLGKYWGVIRELHKLYRARKTEAYCNYAAVFILSLAIAVLGVLDATETADTSQNITDEVENGCL